MIHDNNSAAKRLYGFLLKTPNASPFHIEHWLSIITEDQRKDRHVAYLQRFEAYSLKDQQFLRRYEAELLLMALDESDTNVIIAQIKKRFTSLKYASPTSVVSRFLKESEATNGKS